MKKKFKGYISTVFGLLEGEAAITEFGAFKNLLKIQVEHPEAIMEAFILKEKEIVAIFEYNLETKEFEFKKIGDKK